MLGAVTNYWSSGDNYERSKIWNNSLQVEKEVKLTGTGDIISMKIRGKNVNTGEWYDWHEVQLDIPSFYKSYSDLSSLASALGVERLSGSISFGNLNDIVTDSLYIMYSGTYTNAPSSSISGFLSTRTNTDSNYIKQEYVGYDDKMFVRVRWNGVWKPWYRIVTELATL